jgi:hypothetical protein
MVGLGGLGVDYQLILSWRLHRQVGGFLAFQDAVDVAGRNGDTDRRNWGPYEIRPPVVAK